MNYLAHLFLAEENDDAKLGALLGDFVKGTIIDRYSEKT
jgi:acyl carrier protein phosphodiesterase